MVLVAVPLSIGKAPLKGLISIALFGLGLTITLTAYGAGLTAIGQIVGFQQIQGWMFTIGGAIALFFGFWMLKLVPLRMPGGGSLPGFLQRGGTYGTPFGTGLVLGNWGIGCPDPVFYVLLTVLATTGDVAQGALLTAAYATGRALPIVGLGTLGILGINTIPALARKRAGVESFFGFGLVLLGAFMLVAVRWEMWFEGTWVHNAWNVLMNRANPNWGELAGAFHLHTHGSGILPHLGFLALGIGIPVIWLFLRRRIGVRGVAIGLVSAAAIFTFFFVPRFINPDLPDQLDAMLRLPSYDREVRVWAGEYAYGSFDNPEYDGGSKLVLRVQEGEALLIKMENLGGLTHDLEIEELQFHVNAFAGKTGRGLAFISSGIEPGKYEFYCTVDDHRELGMVGTLVVEPKAAATSAAE